MRHPFIVLLLLLFSSGTLLSAAAQTAPAATATTTSAAAPVRGDTVAAVQRLFVRRRTGGVIWSIIGGAFTAQVLAGSISQGFGDAGGTVVGIAVLGGVPGGIGISKLSRFSKAKEEAVVANYRQRHQLPPYVQKRLKSKFF